MDVLIPEESLIGKIYFIRNQKIMIDRDLAELYGVETKVLNQAVSRNISRFPVDFMFQISEKEWENLKSHFVTSSWGGRRTLPFCFTEQGVAMLSGILKSKKAIEVNIQIMRIFIKVRQMLLDNTELRLAIEEIKSKTINNTKNIELVFQYLDELLDKKEKSKPIKKIGYKIVKTKR